jgi:isoleucyl-tRNA synthetase
LSPDKQRNAKFMCAKPLLKGKGCLYKEDDDTVEILEEHLGRDLKDRKYKPLFPYFASRVEHAFRIVMDTYVTTDTGTGIVHQAPGHGEVRVRVLVTTASFVLLGRIYICMRGSRVSFVAPASGG